MNSPQLTVSIRGIALFMVVLGAGASVLLSSCQKQKESEPADIATAAAIWREGRAVSNSEWEAACHALAQELKVDYKTVRRVHANTVLDLVKTARDQEMTSTMPWSQASAIIRSTAKQQGVELNSSQIEKVGVLVAKHVEGLSHEASAAFH